MRDIRGLVKVAQARGISGKWGQLRNLVQTNHKDLWASLRTCRHFFCDVRADWNAHGMRAVRQQAKRVISELMPRRRKRSSVLWLDLGELGSMNRYYEAAAFQDHGLGLLRTILHNDGVLTDIASTANVDSIEDLAKHLKGYDMMLMNVRSYRYHTAVEASRLFKRLNPNGLTVVGGMHTCVAPEQMKAMVEFDKICIGSGEKVITDLVTKPHTFPRVFEGKATSSMSEWPRIDRTLWPRPASWLLRFKFGWPLEPGQVEWGPRPFASVLTSRVCPWQCSFCNEAAYIPHMRRRPVQAVIEELNELDAKYHLGFVVIHDSMFFQNKKWLETWLDEYPKKARRLWPYWAAARADTVAEWPELFEALIRETNWATVSIGFESGSDPVLRILNKQVTEEENDSVIRLVNRIGDDQETVGQRPVSFWGNIMLAIPGETPEDAFKTIRMLKRMKRVTVPLAFYAAFPGSALGDQLIAEGKNLMTDDFERNPFDDKIKGIDYAFYRGLMHGKYAEQIARGLTPAERDRKVMMPTGIAI